jgi:hypothetical protein
MSNARLIGGSKGLKVSDVNNEDSPSYNANKLPQLNMFIPNGLYPTVLKEKAKVSGYILPAFDDRLSCMDKSYKKSWMSYRDSAIRDESTGNEAFTSWFIPLGELDSKNYVTKGGIYQYFGNSKSTFISPSIADGVGDPIKDLRIHIYKQCKEGNTQFKHLVERPKYNPSAPQETALWALPSPKMAYLVNAYCTGSNQYADDYKEMKNRILMLGMAAFQDLMEDMDAYRPGNMPHVDEDYPDFMYGDITNPSKAIYFESEYIRSNINYVKLNFGNYNKRTGLTYKADDLFKLYPDALENRYDLADTTEIVKVPTYDEVVKQLVIEDTVPYELIAEVCAKKCDNFPENPALATNVSSQAPEPEEEDEIPGIKEAPVWTPKQEVVKEEPVAAPAAVAAPAVASGLTPEEEADLKRLHKLMVETKGANMSVEDITRYSNLYIKAGSGVAAIIQ